MELCYNFMYHFITVGGPRLYIKAAAQSKPFDEDYKATDGVM